MLEGGVEGVESEGVGGKWSVGGGSTERSVRGWIRESVRVMVRVRVHHVMVRVRVRVRVSVQQPMAANPTND